MLYSDALEYKQKALSLHLWDDPYWSILLHMNNGISEIDDRNFFFAKNGNIDAANELNATIDAFYNDTRLDDNNSICRFPARYTWLQQKLQADDFPVAKCQEYNKVLKRIDPQSVTLVFPSAHINSPASMFGHTFVRINSSYHSKLLAYAVNYAADADPDKENAVAFALKGLFGGYFGKYSLLPYYDKLKEYRDTEQRDIWEYDLNLSPDETLRMFQHIWELNGTHSYYYFFTENCSYNMLWLIEAARPSVHLRNYFTYQVIPLETVHVAQAEGLISDDTYRASKRSILLEYEKLISEEFIHIPRELVMQERTAASVLNSNEIPLQQKMYILEASTEFLQYQFSRGKIKKDDYLRLFHLFTSKRAMLGQGKVIQVPIPPNPIESHRALRINAGAGLSEKDTTAYLGIRPAYQDLFDSNYGFLRGTQIEFLDLQFSKTNEHSRVEKATILSIASLAQRSEFFDSFSWRTKFGWDRDYLNNKTLFQATIGAGFSWGDDLGYIYLMLDPQVYLESIPTGALAGSLGFCIDKYRFTSTNFETQKRFFDNGKQQIILNASQNFRLSQNIQLQFKYSYKERALKSMEHDYFTLMLNLYF